MAASDATGGDGRAPMQDWTSFPEFLLEEHWNLLQSRTERPLKKVEVLSRHLVNLGLRHPSERTMCTLASVVSHCTGDHNDEDAAKLQALLQTVKSVLKTHTTRAKQVSSPLFAYMQTLPASVAGLPQLMRNHFFPGGACQAPVDLARIYASAVLWPCRSTNRQITLARQVLGGNVLMNGPASLSMVAQQAALQTAAAFATLSQSSQSGGEVPGLQILPAGHRAIANGQGQSSALAALMDRAQSQVAASVPALMDRAQSQGAASVPALMERAQSQAAASVPVVVDRDQSQGVAAVPAMAPVTVPAPAASEGPGALENSGVVTEIPAVGAEQAQQELECCVLGLAEQHYGSTLPDLPDVHGPDDSNKQRAKRGRPAGQLKKPAACPKTVAKKPAAQVKRACQKPARNTKSVSKKPAGNTKTVSKKADHTKTVTRQQALRQRLEGCARCRHTAGCCPSCWTQRGYRLL